MSNEWSDGASSEATNDSAGDAWSAPDDQAGLAWEQAPEQVTQAWTEVPDPSDEPAAPSGESESSLVAPWYWEDRYWPGKSPSYLNYEGAAQEYDSDWVIDREGTALVSADASLAAAVAVLYVPVSSLIQGYLSLVSGAAVSYWTAYHGYAVGRRLIARTVAVHEWYGRYRVNVLTREVVAVLFEGRSETRLILARGDLLQQLRDAEGNVLYETKNKVPSTSFDTDSAVNLPEWSYGDNLVWDI